jgi:hypothetical protein
LEVGVMEDLKVAGLLRRQAGMLRAQGAMCMEHAGVLEGMAEVLGAGAPATLVTEDGQQLAVQEREQRHKRPPLVTPDEGEWSAEMREFVEAFHPRFSSSRHFRAVLAAAGEAGMRIEPETREWVAEEVRQRELDEEGAERVARFDEAAGIQEQEGVPLVTPADRVDREKLERGS